MCLANSKHAHLLLMAFAFLAGFALAAPSAFANSPTCTAAEYKGQTFQGRSITSGFGTRASGQTTNGNSMSSYHRALDLSVAGNPNVGAFHGGTVTHAGPMGGWGNTVVVTNGNFQVQYGHAGTMNVTPGQTITPGQNLGNWGTCSGNCTGPHVDLIYRVNINGQWSNVDPIIAEQLIASGLDPNSPELAQKALEQTANRCSVDPNSLASRNRTGPGNTTTETGEMCDPNIRAAVSEQVEGALAKKNDFVKSNTPAPPSVSQVANTPCMSKELQRITNQFARYPGQQLGSLTGGLMSAAAPISGIMSKFFKAEFDSISQAASILPNMLNFQTQASSVLSGLLGSLGLGDAFSSEVCGMMVDMLLKYIQCENPIKLPNLNLQIGSLNNLLPKGCAGSALSSTLMQAGNSQSLRTWNQPINTSTGGQFVAGSADSINQSRGLSTTTGNSTTPASTQ